MCPPESNRSGHVFRMLFTLGRKQHSSPKDRLHLFVYLKHIEGYFMRIRGTTGDVDGTNEVSDRGD